MVFENVGGAQFEAAFRCLGKGGVRSLARALPTIFFFPKALPTHTHLQRLAVCGAIADYHHEKPPTV
jgi:NADPH-dependent curcumin reductase CurA